MTFSRLLPQDLSDIPLGDLRMWLYRIEDELKHAHDRGGWHPRAGEVELDALFRLRPEISKREKTEAFRSGLFSFDADGRPV